MVRAVALRISIGRSRQMRLLASLAAALAAAHRSPASAAVAGGWSYAVLARQRRSQAAAFRGRTALAEAWLDLPAALPDAGTASFLRSGGRIGPSVGCTASRSAIRSILTAMATARSCTSRRARSGGASFRPRRRTVRPARRSPTRARPMRQGRSGCFRLKRGRSAELGGPPPSQARPGGVRVTAAGARLSPSDRSGDLSVEPHQVVLGEPESTDGRLRLYSTLRPVPIVAVEPGRQLCGAVGRGRIGPSIRPLSEGTG